MLHLWNKKLRQMTASILDLPQDVIIDLPRITMIGNLHLYIENHRGVMVFTDRMLQLRLSVGQLVIEGENLVIRTILPEEILVEGTIQHIRYVQ